MASLLKKKLKGFTLVEILVTVTIIAILASIAVIATNQARLKSRDIKRISNAREIVNALEAYYARNQSYPTMIFRGQPIESNGKEYLKEVPSNPFPRTDGGCADSDYTYITTTTGYKFTFCIGSDNSRFEKGIVICRNGNCGFKEDCSGVITDIDGISYPIVRIGEQCWMAAHLKTKKRPDGSCVNLTGPLIGSITDPTTCITTYPAHYPGQNFGGNGGCPVACIRGSRRDCIKNDQPLYGPGHPLWDDGWGDRGKDTLSSVYDYPPISTESACNNRGALYTWSGAMNLSDICNENMTNCTSLITSPHRGICPLDWHIPTDSEFHTLEASLVDSGQSCDGTRNNNTFGSDSCRTAGNKLKTGDFNAILLGARTSTDLYNLFEGMEFQGKDTTVHIWTATSVSNSDALTRIIELDVSGTYRFHEPKDAAFAVRCIRDF